MERSTGKSGAGPNKPASAAGRDREPVLREPVLVEKEGWQIAGTLFRSAEGSAGARPAVALVSDAASDAGAGSSLDSLAEALARAGMVALRMAPSASGADREPGTTSGVDPDPGRDVHPIQLALDIVAGQPDVDLDHLALVGAGWSGVVATCVAERDTRVAGVVVWEPQPKPQRAGTERGKRERGAAQADTGSVYGQFLQRCRGDGADAVEVNRGAPLRVLIVHGASDDVAARVEPLRQAFDHPGIQYDVVPIRAEGAGLTHPASRDAAVEQTVGWLQSTVIASE